jgi:hypothetical protein
VEVINPKLDFIRRNTGLSRIHGLSLLKGKNMNSGRKTAFHRWKTSPPPSFAEQERSPRIHPPPGGISPLRDGTPQRASPVRGRKGRGPFKKTLPSSEAQDWDISNFFLARIGYELLM